MIYNRELAKRFVSDCKLPIPIISEESFLYHINLYEEDYGSLTKYKQLWDTIERDYQGMPDIFLDHYYDVRENIIQSVLNNDAYKRFNNMDMSCFAIKYKPQVTSKNIYNNENIGKFFISIDLKKANFQTLKNIDKDILFGADTYEDFVGRYTYSEYIKQSKYTREVIFGKLNPKRHITAEKYFITEIYKTIVNKYPHLDGKCVSLSNDEIVFRDEWLNYNSKFMCFAMRKDIEEVVKAVHGFDVRVEFFFLHGYHLAFKESGSIRSTFYTKDYMFTEGDFKLICAPLPYHSIMYKLYKGKELEEMDYHFNYEGMDARFCEDFTLIKNIVNFQ